MGWISKLFGPSGYPEYLPLVGGANYIFVPPVDFVVFDLETTGLDPSNCEILEVGAIRYRNSQPVQQYHTYIQSRGAIPIEASRINGIKWSTVSSAPFLQDIEDTLLAFFGEDTLVGFNVSFDIKFLQTRLRRKFPNPVFDVLNYVKGVYPGYRSYKLDVLRKMFSLPGSAHTAIGDCQSTASLLEKCISQEKKAMEQKIRLAEMKMQMEHERRIRDAEYKAVKEEEKRKEKLRKESLQAEKDKAKTSLPPRGELYRVSELMEGTEIEYFQKVHEILTEANIDISKIFPLKKKGLCVSHKGNTVAFFDVQLETKLRYIVLRIPPRKIHCEYICAPSTMQEGEASCRIFVPSPSALDNIKRYIIASYQAAAEEAGLERC